MLAWHSQGLVSLPSLSKQTSFIPNAEGSRMEKDTLEPSGMCRNLFMNPEAGYSGVSYELHMLPEAGQAVDRCSQGPVVSVGL